MRTSEISKQTDAGTGMERWLQIAKRKAIGNFMQSLFPFFNVFYANKK